MSRPVKVSELSPARQVLVRLCQRINFGQIHNLHLRGGDPVFDPSPLVLVDEKLDSEDAPRPEAELTDFDLPAEVGRLISKLDLKRDGMIDRLEVRAGVPRRAVFVSDVHDLFRLEKKEELR